MGTRRFKNGNVYTGNYVDGKRQGQGKCFFANGGKFQIDPLVHLDTVIILHCLSNMHCKICIRATGRMIPFKVLAGTTTTMAIVLKACFEMVSATAEGSISSPTAALKFTDMLMTHV